MSVRGLQDLSCYGFKLFDYSSPTEAQLRLAPNRPCMSLVLHMTIPLCSSARVRNRNESLLNLMRVQSTYMHVRLHVDRRE